MAPSYALDVTGDLRISGTFRVNLGVAAPGTSAGGVITSYYGTSATTFLSTPTEWIQIVNNGNVRKIPCYA
jgi:hypothetical protein